MILKPFMLRRIKKDVENELSDKVCSISQLSLLFNVKIQQPPYGKTDSRTHQENDLLIAPVKDIPFPETNLKTSLKAADIARYSNIN